MNLRDYFTTTQAAEFLGVSPGTVRNWERAGRLPARRHPINDYRLFDPRDLKELLARVQRTTKPAGSNRRHRRN